MPFTRGAREVPNQTPASNSDARKRKAEKDGSVTGQGWFEDESLPAFEAWENPPGPTPWQAFSAGWHARAKRPAATAELATKPTPASQVKGDTKTQEWQGGDEALVRVRVVAEADKEDGEPVLYVTPVERLTAHAGHWIKAADLLPVPAAGEAATEDVVERAARVLAQLEPGEDWPSNAALGGNLTGTRDDEYRDAMLDQARDLARAGLLVGGVPGRSEGEIKAEALREAADAWTQGAWADEMPPKGADRPALILGMAQRAGDWLRARAAQVSDTEGSN